MTSRDWNRILLALGIGAAILYFLNRRPASAAAAPAPGSPQLPAPSSNPLLQSMDTAVINLATGVAEL